MPWQGLFHMNCVSGLGGFLSCRAVSFLSTVWHSAVTSCKPREPFRCHRCRQPHLLPRGVGTAALHVLDPPVFWGGCHFPSRTPSLRKGYPTGTRQRPRIRQGCHSETCPPLRFPLPLLLRQLRPCSPPLRTQEWSMETAKCWPHEPTVFVCLLHPESWWP